MLVIYCSTRTCLRFIPIECVSSWSRTFIRCVIMLPFYLHANQNATCLQNTNPHSQLVFYHVLLCYGRRLSDFFRSNKRWQPLMPLLMDHVRVDIDHGIEDAYFGNAGTSTGSLMDTSVPIEAKLRSLSVRLLYEVSRVQKMTMHDLRQYLNGSLLDIPDRYAHRNI